MIGAKVDKREIRRLKRSLKQLGASSREDTIKAMSAAGLDMQNAARVASPVKTGRLRRSLRYEPIEGGLGAKLFTNIHYAPYQNNGTARMSGKKFMEKGFYAGVQRLNRTLKLK